MKSIGLEECVVDWAIEHPESIAVFEKYGVDYCCGGKSLEFACRQRGVDPVMILEEIRRAIRERDRRVDGG